MRRLPISGQYAEDGKARRLKVREEAGHRCIRCGHPFQIGKHGKGEWSPCDEQCTHKGPIRKQIMMDDWLEIVSNATAGWLYRAGNVIQARWRILTVHHFDGDKSNDAWWNTLALCQRCHLAIQCRVDPNIPFMFEHSSWLKPYVAGYYAKKYEGKDLTREQVMEHLDELLDYERKA